MSASSIIRGVTARSTRIAAAAVALGTLLTVTSAGHAGGTTAVAGGDRHSTSLSKNWSGAALKSGRPGTFQGVAAEFRVPRVRPGAGNRYACTWVGVDGANNRSLIQTGIETDWVDGHAVYYAWTEILPAAQRRIRFSSTGALVPVVPGDYIWAYVSKTSIAGVWKIHLENLTHRWTFDQSYYYKGPGRSAEWIEEATQVGGRYTLPANFRSVRFTDIQYKYNGTWYYTRLRAANDIWLKTHGHVWATGTQTHTTPQAVVVTYRPRR